MKAWALVPARGGSKSILHKNIIEVGGRPLMEYGVRAAQASGCFEKIVCSTDDAAIASCATTLGIEVAKRSAALSSDEAKVDEVAQNFLAAFPQDSIPDVLILVQPTSPFVLPEHFVDLFEAFEKLPHAASIHNVIKITHNVHAWNQRTLDSQGNVEFLFAAERRRSRNKQEKPELNIFGNLIGARTEALLAGMGFYADPIHAIKIKSRWGFDLDGPEDLELAEAMLSSGYVTLDHLSHTQP